MSQDTPAHFPSFLLSMVSDDTQQAIVWDDSGEHITIVDLKIFMKQLLPKYYKYGNAGSFLRQCHNYHFQYKKLDNGSIVLSHPKFRRSDPEIIKTIVVEHKVRHDVEDKSQLIRVADYLSRQADELLYLVHCHRDISLESCFPQLMGMSFQIDTLLTAYCPIDQSQYNDFMKPIKKLILEQFGCLSMVFDSTYSEMYKLTVTVVTIEDNEFMITPRLDWPAIKSDVEAKLRLDRKTHVCEICMEDRIHSITCSKCRNKACYQCRIDIYTANNGEIKCPWCRYIHMKRAKDPSTYSHGIQFLKDHYGSYRLSRIEKYIKLTRS